jgi:hypothetical protein
LLLLACFFSLPDIQLFSRRFTEEVGMQKNYVALNIIGTVFRVLGWITLVVSALSLIAFPIMFGSNLLSDVGVDLGGLGIVAGIAAGVMVLIVGAIQALLLMAIGDLFKVLVGIEENTRATVIMLQQKP